MKLEAKQRLQSSMPVRETWEALVAVKSDERQYQADGKHWYSVYLPDAKKKVRRMKDSDFKAALAALEKQGAYRPQETDPEYFGCIGMSR
jgi:hypothetical protein